ncbi:hypothetical protein PO909_019186 [Leuciscus waleckii]
MPNFTCLVESSRLRHQWEAQPVLLAHATPACEIFTQNHSGLVSIFCGLSLLIIHFVYIFSSFDPQPFSKEWLKP